MHILEIFLIKFSIFEMQKMFYTGIIKYFVPLANTHLFLLHLYERVQHLKISLEKLFNLSANSMLTIATIVFFFNPSTYFYFV
ncbi:hypothetical protein GCM10011384_06180 [Psychrobacillus lasiicapitis]|nr:hypothetical protein GCM10011384_06180 [Psychrobacillus lasiicapitis]